ncbi:MAG TPA: hypothetical protein VHY21_08225 [Pseudonocardiaceae bacterium]|nr:hypothetical protein [Pseudonocardiaceae bacterium]
MTTAVLLPGGDVVVPAAMLAALLAELEAARAPMGVVVPRRTPQMAELAETLREAAIAHRQRLRATTRACPLVARPEPAPSLPMLAGPSEDDGVVSVAVAAGMLGVSPQWCRVLAANGALPGARKVRGLVGNGRGTARLRWCIPAASVRAYPQGQVA